MKRNKARRTLGVIVAVGLAFGAVAASAAPASATGTASKNCNINQKVTGKSTPGSDNTTSQPSSGGCGKVGVKILYYPSGTAYWSAYTYSETKAVIHNPGYTVSNAKHTATLPDFNYEGNFPFET